MIWGKKKLVDIFNVCIMLVLWQRKVNMTKNGVNNVGFQVFDESTKSMGMENREDMGRKSIKGKMKRDIFIISELEVLDTRDFIEELD